MRTCTRVGFGLLLAALTMTVGCQKLNVKRTIHINPGEVQDVIIDGPRSEQKISAQISASAPIDAHVILSAEEQDVKSKLLAGQKPADSKVLDKALKVDNATLKATIPPRNEFRVVLSGARKPTDVDVEVKNQ